MYNVTILTEAGNNIGFGHYTRCIAIRDHLLSAGVLASILIYCRDIKINDKNIIEFNWMENIYVLPNVNQSNCVVIDSYLAGADLYATLKKTFRKVIAIDDFNRIQYDASLVINPNVYFDRINYSNQTSPCIGGKNFVILRKPFRKAVTKTIHKSCKKVLVTMGGSDYRDLFQVFIDIAYECQDYSWIIVNPEDKKINKIPPNCKLLGIADANLMAKLMSQADVAFTGCGQTLHELVAIQTPAIGICIDQDQVKNQEYYFSAGFLQHKNIWSAVDLRNNLLNQLLAMKPQQVRQALSSKCSDLINRDGINNVTSNLLVDYT